MQNWLTVREFLTLHQGMVSKNTVYDRIRDKTLPSIRLGRKILIPADALDRVLVGQQVQAQHLELDG